MWKRLLISLRIKERVDGYEVEGEEPDVVPQDDHSSGMDSEKYIDDGGGGFLID
jgi:xeroderma pigmentosum group C-complementing protein